jgi:hypothetical protein
VTNISKMAEKRRVWVIGEHVGLYELVGFVADNPDAEYLKFRCPCGAVITVPRVQVSNLLDQKNCKYCRNYGNRTRTKKAGDK